MGSQGRSSAGKTIAIRRAGHNGNIERSDPRGLERRREGGEGCQYPCMEQQQPWT